MHAIRLHAFGPAENLLYEEVEDPHPGLGQVRIAVAAAGIHLIDARIRSGVRMGPLPLPDLPAIPGREVAGNVDAIGPDVNGRWLGARVVAHLGMASAGYAELALAPVTSLHRLPAYVADDAAVAMIGTGRTTMAILDLARPTADDVVLVMAAAGGIGTLLVQAARESGATIAGVAGGPSKVELVKELGADVAVDYTQPGWLDEVRDGLGGRPVSLLYDGVGGEVARDALALLGDGGRVVVHGWSAGGRTEPPRDDPRGLQLLTLPRPEHPRVFEGRSLGALASGRLVPVVGQHFPLARAAIAHTALESRATMGKTVLVP